MDLQHFPEPDLDRSSQVEVPPHLPSLGADAQETRHDPLQGHVQEPEGSMVLAAVQQVSSSHGAPKRED